MRTSSPESGDRSRRYRKVDLCPAVPLEGLGQCSLSHLAIFPREIFLLLHHRRKTVTFARTTCLNQGDCHAEGARPYSDIRYSCFVMPFAFSATICKVGYIWCTGISG